MSDYIKHVFNSGDILTAEQLNVMNDQIELDANQVGAINNQLSTITSQLDGKANLTGATFTGDVEVVGNVTISGNENALNATNIHTSSILEVETITGVNSAFRLMSIANGIIETGNLMVGTSGNPTTAVAYFSDALIRLNKVTYFGSQGAYLHGTDVSYMPSGIKTRLFLTSPNGTLFEIKISDGGEISATEAQSYNKRVTSISSSLKYSYIESTNTEKDTQEIAKNYDVDGSGAVNIADVSAMLDALAGHVPEGATTSNYDVNKDGAVTVGDLTALIDKLAGAK